MFVNLLDREHQLKIIVVLLGMFGGSFYASISRTVENEWTVQPMKDEAPINETEAFMVADDTTLADDLAKRISILCWIYMHQKSDDRIKAINSTWGARCTKVLFLSNFESDTPDVIDIRSLSTNATVKSDNIKAAYQYIYSKYRDDFDWFLKAEDDAYIVLENLRYFLYAFESSQPLSLGHKMNSTEVQQGYFSNVPGYVMSKSALQLLNEGFASNTKCKYLDQHLNTADDLLIGKCLEEIGVIALDSRENDGKERFFAKTLDDFLLPNEYVEFPRPWYQPYVVDHHLNDASNYSIAFCGLSANQMHVMEFFVYQMRPYGADDYTPPLPDKIKL